MPKNELPDPAVAGRELAIFGTLQALVKRLPIEERALLFGSLVTRAESLEEVPKETAVELLDSLRVIFQPPEGQAWIAMS